MIWTNRHHESNGELFAGEGYSRRADQSQPFDSAILTASARVDAPVLPIADDR